MESPATCRVRATCLQVIRIKIKAESCAEQLEHDSGQRNNVSKRRGTLKKGAATNLCDNYIHFYSFLANVSCKPNVSFSKSRLAGRRRRKNCAQKISTKGSQLL